MLLCGPPAFRWISPEQSEQNVRNGWKADIAGAKVLQ
jgi:hypothetical protein